MKKQNRYIAQEPLKLNKKSLQTSYVAVLEKPSLNPVEKLVAKKNTTTTRQLSTGVSGAPGVLEKFEDNSIKPSSSKKTLEKSINSPPQVNSKSPKNRELLNTLFKTLPSNEPPMSSPNNKVIFFG